MSKIKGISYARARIEGVSPLLMHNCQLANPMNEYAQAIKVISSKHHSKRTDTDELERIRLEFQGGLYFYDTIGPYIPSVMIEGCLREAAKVNRKGQSVSAGLQISPDEIKLIYEGPIDRDSLFSDKNFVDSRPVKLKKADTIVRTRPRFDKWALEFEIMTIDEILNISDVRQFIEIGGMRKAIGDFRPKFGRFALKQFEML